MRAGPGTQLLLSEVQIGWSVWEHIDALAAHEPRGGVVVNIDARPDRDTGEIVKHFRTLKTFHGQLRFADLTEHQINPDSLQLPNTATIRGLIRRLNKEIAESKGMFTPEHFDKLDVAWRLMQAVA